MTHHHEAHEGHEGDLEIIIFNFSLRALRGLRGENVCFDSYRAAEVSHEDRQHRSCGFHGQRH
jgi:hypothetical protein